MVIDKMIQNKAFHNISNHRIVGSKIIFNKLADDEALLQVNSCDAGHDSEKIARMVIWTSNNILLNNYCSKQNNILSENKLNGKGKKRKLKTLTDSKNKKTNIYKCFTMFLLILFIKIKSESGCFCVLYKPNECI